uniref:ATE_C domain-containing protein n=1 Tax=Caenorhabditis japonica TaxID=281687 RepID=A0A8R1DF23_CAEJA
MYYDPDYSFLSIGTYTALREIEKTQHLQRICPTLTYYYMGYYIHSCPKMRYKAKFRPSDLLCDKSLQWLEFEHCKPLLDASDRPNGFAEFRPDASRPAPIAMDRVLVITNGTVMPFSRAIAQNPQAAENEELRGKVREIANLIGPSLAGAAFWFTELNGNE